MEIEEYRSSLRWTECIDIIGHGEDNTTTHPTNELITSTAAAYPTLSLLLRILIVLIRTTVEAHMFVSIMMKSGVLLMI